LVNIIIKQKKWGRGELKFKINSNKMKKNKRIPIPKS
jgi:hypothetical protein